MAEDPNVNPYQPPESNSTSRPVDVPLAPDRPKRKEVDRVLLFVLPIASAFWLFVVGAAIYELVSMPADAYGPNRSLFRRSYYLTLSKGLAMGVTCVASYWMVHRGTPHARIVGSTAIVLSVLSLIFLL